MLAIEHNCGIDTTLDFFCVHITDALRIQSTVRTYWSEALVSDEAQSLTRCGEKVISIS